MNIRDFSEFTIELFVSLILSDIEEVIHKGKSSIRKQEKEIITEWLTWIDENRNFFSDDTLDLIERQFEDDLGAMPIWKSDKELQEEVLNGFRDYFGEDSYFYELFKNAYLTGLEDGGLM
ncbi:MULTISPECIES: hypothetical protein [Bacillaceae]|uniref:hypothetical protein n=1 Tax=Bacillaceae TaxID=186817 RepID=UPI0008F916EA|nr:MULTISPECIES: hypothetical protein [Bacillaceae]GLB61808.1 hypothetical protein NCCP133_39370 [Cytobacillus sp. NCCP-133]